MHVKSGLHFQLKVQFQFLTQTALWALRFFISKNPVKVNLSKICLYINTKLYNLKCLCHLLLVILSKMHVDKMNMERKIHLKKETLYTTA